jgi:RimJ/RimL family protein N-acetyltransferase
MFRPATIEDSADWLNIRNDKEALFWSGNKKPIGLAEHESWFQRVLQTPGHYLAVDAELGNPAIVNAYGRIQAYTEAEVSFGVAPAVRGKGIGSTMLCYLEQQAQQRRIQRLVAYVSPANIASMRAFMKNGYVLETNHRHFEKLTKVLG